MKHPRANTSLTWQALLALTVVFAFTVIAGGISELSKHSTVPQAQAATLDTTVVKREIDSLQRVQMHIVLNRLYKYGYYEARHDTTHMCFEVMDNWLGLENDVMFGDIQMLAPSDSVDFVHRTSYILAAKFLRNYCSKSAATLKAADERWKSYMRARLVAYAAGK